MKEKLTDILATISQTLQGAQLEWVLLAIFAVLVLLLVFAFDKFKSIQWLLVLYIALFVLLQLSGAEAWTLKKMPDYAKYLPWIVGGIPAVALGVLKFRRKK